MAFNSFEVIGGNQIGDKASFLQDFQPLIKEVGLLMPDTTILASEMVRAGIDANLNEPTVEALEQAGQRHAEAPVLVIRSSALGDGSGNGVYESRFATNQAEIIIDEARLVFSSFASESAQDFRRQADVGSEFAIMIQPVVGQDIQSSEYWQNYGPFLSGYGYSSTSRHPSGYLNVVAGIGGGVSRKRGQFVSPEELDSVSEASWDVQFKHHPQYGSFFDYLTALAHESLEGTVTREDTDFQGRDGLRSWSASWPDSYALAQYLHRRTGKTAYEYQPSGLISTGSFSSYDKTDFAKAMKQFIPGELFDKLQLLEKRAGHPLYVEWALTMDPEVQPVIVQIAPAEQTAQTQFEAKIEGKNLCHGELLTGAGVHKAKKIVIVGGPLDIVHLKEFNQDPANEGYILMFGEARASALAHQYQLTYNDCSKAGVLVEVASSDIQFRHAPMNGDVVEHLFGASRQTNKTVGRIRESTPGRSPEVWQYVFERGTLWQAPGKAMPGDNSSGIEILDGDFTVYADNRHGRITITQDT